MTIPIIILVYYRFFNTLSATVHLYIRKEDFEAMVYYTGALGLLQYIDSTILPPIIEEVRVITNNGCGSHA